MSVESHLVELERRREALVAANREVKSLENLKQRQLERHQAVAAQKELAALDEAAGRVASQEES